MGFEIDFLPVGAHSKSGDAILARWGDLTKANPWGTRSVAVIDGGFHETGEAIIDHVRDCYETQLIDVMVSTHPDNDHICGLIAVMESNEVEVGELWIHQPWKYLTCRLSPFQLQSSGASAFNAYVANAKHLHQLAERKGVEIKAPFTRVQHTGSNGTLTVAGPTEDFYKSLVGDFGAASVGSVHKASRPSLFRKVNEDLDTESLTDDGTTSAANNSSVITLLEVDGHRVLLTGDAGMPALTNAMPAIDPDEAGPLSFIQVPHHGSRHNVGPTILNQLLGHPSPLDGARGVAYCSAAKENPEAKRPAKMVTNAFHRRGYPVSVTAGNAICVSHNAPNRQGWEPLDAEQFHPSVENLNR